MSNKELYKKELGKTIIDVIIGDTIKIVFEDSEIDITDYHDQDCCEHVYADFSIVEYHKKNLIGKKVSEFIIKGIEDMGFLLCFMEEYGVGEKIFIPCYNHQNGYYSSDLKLIVKTGVYSTEINISDLTEYSE